MSSPHDVGVIVVAGGRGSRLGGDTPKQFLEVGGVPMLLRAIRCFLSHQGIVQVVAVLPQEHVASPPAWLGALVGERLALVAGGAERTDSVRHGLAALRPGIPVVLVHDAARPFAAAGLVDRVISAVGNDSAVVPALPVADTIKELDPAHPDRVGHTVPRERLVRVQTPQGFPRDLLERAHARATMDGSHGTDDAQLVERLGGTVYVVPGDAGNIKITTPEDLVLANWMAGLRP